MDIVMKIVNAVISAADFLWGVPMLTILSVLAIILTIGCRGFQFTHIIHIIKNTLGNIKQGEKEETGISSFKATCMTLCNTIGTGNIAGVSLAIALGGPGALFWMWVACFFGMIIKYSEIVLAMKYNEINKETGLLQGGVMWYIKKGLPKHWHWLATAFAGVYVIVVLNAPAVQVNTAVSAITAYFHIPSMLLGGIMVIAMAIVGYGGLRRISDFAGKIVPFMAIAYIAVALAVIFMNIGNLPQTFVLIFKYAASDIGAMAGGFGGATVMLAIRHGLCRGFYSSGAGAGDATFSHSSAVVDHPAKQGMWAIVEVAIDGLVVTASGLMVLVTGAWETGISGAPLVSKAIAIAFNSEVFGNIFVIIGVFLFAFTSAFMCLYYSELCLKNFTHNKVIIMTYRVIICAWAFFATNATFVEQVSIIWRFGDFGSVCLMIVACTAVFLLRKDVFEITADYKSIIKREQ